MGLRVAGHHMYSQTCCTWPRPLCYLGQCDTKWPNYRQYFLLPGLDPCSCLGFQAKVPKLTKEKHLLSPQRHADTEVRSGGHCDEVQVAPWPHRTHCNTRSAATGTVKYITWYIRPRVTNMVPAFRPQRPHESPPAGQLGELHLQVSSMQPCWVFADDQCENSLTWSVSSHRPVSLIITCNYRLHVLFQKSAATLLPFLWLSTHEVAPRVRKVGDSCLPF